MMQYDVAVIGAGTAGLHAWRSASKAGSSVVMIERGERGSTCTKTGCIPSKFLLSAARAAASARSADQFGIHIPDVRIDGAKLLKRLRADRDQRDDAVRDEYRKIPEDKRIKGTARFVDRNTLEIDGQQRISARSMIIATGGTPVVPKSLAPVSRHVHTHETIFEIEQLPDRLAVIGAGPLGLELAQAFARLGTSVTVFDSGDTIAALADPEAQMAAQDALRQDMVLRLGVELTSSSEGARARLSWTGREAGTDVFDMILAATSREPNTKELGLETLGVELDDDGIPRFDRASRRCGDSEIYLVGDAGDWRPVLHEAARGGTIAGEQATGQPMRRQIPEIAITFTEPNIASVGTSFDALPDDAIIGTAKVTDNARAGIEGDNIGLVRLYGDRDGMLVGGAIVAPNGEHLAQSLAIALDAGMTVERFADQAWYHPVLEELLQSAGRDAASKMEE
jgi:dihydrolipoamide dehydrogenase